MKKSFAEWLALQEMPIDMKFVGNWEDALQKGDEIGWDKPSHKLLSNPRALEKIKKTYNSIPHDFQVYFIGKIPGFRAEQSPIEEITPQKLEKLKLSKLAINPNKINILLTQSDRHPMTGWIIAHRFAHLLEPYVRKYKDVWEKIFNSVLTDVYNVEPNERPSWALSNALGTMRSARNNQLQPEEFISEMVTQYIMTKKGIQFNELPEILPIRPLAGETWQAKEGDGFPANPIKKKEKEILLSKFALKFNTFLEELMGDMNGRIFIW